MVRIVALHPHLCMQLPFWIQGALPIKHAHLGKVFKSQFHTARKRHLRSRFGAITGGSVRVGEAGCLYIYSWVRLGLMGQGEKSVGGAENPTWNPRYLPPLSPDFFPSDLYFICIRIYPVPFQSAQRLIESLDSLEYIGPMEMFTKLSKVRIVKALSNSARWTCLTSCPG